MKTTSNINENPWNPYNPTERDIKRTQELASKNAVLVGVITCLIIPVGLIYLNRGVNALKIFGYLVAASVIMGTVAESEKSADDVNSLLGLIANGAITAEQVMTVNKARQRLLLDK